MLTYGNLEGNRILLSDISAKDTHRSEDPIPATVHSGEFNPSAILYFQILSLRFGVIVSLFAQKTAKKAKNHPKISKMITAPVGGGTTHGCCGFLSWFGFCLIFYTGRRW